MRGDRYAEHKSANTGYAEFHVSVASIIDEQTGHLVSSALVPHDLTFMVTYRTWPVSAVRTA
jgi:hypothetical protein